MPSTTTSLSGSQPRRGQICAKTLRPVSRGGEIASGLGCCARLAVSVQKLQRRQSKHSSPSVFAEYSFLGIGHLTGATDSIRRPISNLVTTKGPGGNSIRVVLRV